MHGSGPPLTRSQPCRPLGDAVEGSRCSVYGARTSRELMPGGGQVRRSYAPATVDVQSRACAPRAVLESPHGPEIAELDPWSTQSPDLETPGFADRRGFAFLAGETRGAIVPATRPN